MPDMIWAPWQSFIRATDSSIPSSEKAILTIVVLPECGGPDRTMHSFMGSSVKTMELLVSEPDLKPQLHTTTISFLVYVFVDLSNQPARAQEIRHKVVSIETLPNVVQEILEFEVWIWLRN